MRVKDIMDTTLNLVRTSDTFEHLRRTLDEVKYRIVFVVNREDKLVRIVTEADIIKVLVPKYISFDEFLISAMNENYLENKCSDSMISLTKPDAENMFTTAIITLWFSAIASTAMENTILIASIIFMKGNM